MLNHEGGMFFKDLPIGGYYFHHLSHYPFQKIGEFEAVEAGTPQTIRYPANPKERVVPLSVKWDCGEPVGIVIGHRTIPIPNEKGPVLDSTGDGS